MKFSIVKYGGGSVNGFGNLSIAGHNNYDGTMFGKTKNLEVGDIVKLTDLKKQTITYQIYSWLISCFNYDDRNYTRCKSKTKCECRTKSRDNNNKWNRGRTKKVKEERNLRWTQIYLKLNAKSAKISNKKSPEEVITEIKKAEISVEKSSTLTKLQGNTHSDIAEYGDTIKYTIKVTNKGNATGTVTVKDTVPEGTTLLPYDEKTTNLTAEGHNKLASNEGLSKDLEVEADYVKTIEFTVKVTGVAGTKIANSATYKTPEKEDNAKDPNEYLIGKEIKITKNTESIKTTNSNIVLVIDVSGSMKDNNRLKNAKEAAKKLIDGVDFTSGDK